MLNFYWKWQSNQSIRVRCAKQKLISHFLKSNLNWINLNYSFTKDHTLFNRFRCILPGWLSLIAMFGHAWRLTFDSILENEWSHDWEQQWSAHFTNGFTKQCVNDWIDSRQSCWKYHLRWQKYGWCCKFHCGTCCQWFESHHKFVFCRFVFFLFSFRW